MTAVIRSCPEDFIVSEQLGFELSGDGEHVFLYLQKRNLNSMDLLQRLSELSGIGQRDIGISGLKDRNAVTRQWFSVGLAGRTEPDWLALEAAGDVRVLQQGRHLRKLRRGVHRANSFSLVLRQLRGDRAGLEQRLQSIREQGVPNYFGEQRFGRNGATLEQARRSLLLGHLEVAAGDPAAGDPAAGDPAAGRSRGRRSRGRRSQGGRSQGGRSRGRRMSRQKRSMYLSALRSFLFNSLLAARVEAGDWDRILAGDVCMLQGSRSLFTCDVPDADICERARCGDLHPGLPLWGGGSSPASKARAQQQRQLLAPHHDICKGLERAGLELAWRPARMLPDDFCWEFCDDGTLQLDFALGAGSYATALLAEFVQYNEG